MNKYLCFIIFHLSSTLHFDLMLENELFAFTLFIMGINDSVHDQIGFRTLSRSIVYNVSSSFETFTSTFAIKSVAI